MKLVVGHWDAAVENPKSPRPSLPEATAGSRKVALLGDDFPWVSCVRTSCRCTDGFVLDYLSKDACIANSLGFRDPEQS